jgi:hypothetical protein
LQARRSLCEKPLLEKKALTAARKQPSTRIGNVKTDDTEMGVSKIVNR